jgi:ABC-type sugar transport system ATPase subunit
VFQPTSGSIALDGREVSFANPSESQAHGVQVVYQDLALADRQTVYMNMFLGREATTGPFGRLDRRRMITDTEALLRDLDVHVPSATVPVRDLSGGQRQGIAIARATHWATKLILMDEPTAALGIAETARVERTIAGLKSRGLAILIISHSLDQVFRVADSICVLRRGKQIGIRRVAETSTNEIVSMITGVA